MAEQAKQCNEQKAGLIENKNGLLKIRAEVLSMEGLKVFTQDCKVSAWVPGECDKPCGGGQRVMTRDILVQPVGEGVKCQMGQWGGWSSCSAKCGGGVYERVRDIVRRG